MDEHKIKEIKVLDGNILEARFFTGEVFDITLSELTAIDPLIKSLSEDDLFKTASLWPLGYIVEWENDICIESDDIWKYGKKKTVESVNNPNYQIANAVISASREAGLTQAELGKKANITQADINRIENAKGNPTVLTLKRIADALGMDLKIEFVPKNQKYDLEDLNSNPMVAEGV